MIYIHIYIFFSHLHVYTHILYIDIHTPGAYYKCSIYNYVYQPMDPPRLSRSAVVESPEELLPLGLQRLGSLNYSPEN